MLWKRGLIVTACIFLTCACGPPVLDTSSGPDLVASLASLEEALESDRQEAFRDAIGYLTDNASTGIDVGLVEPVLPVFAPLEGKTADEIILLAWTRQIDELRERTSSLEARKAAGAKAQSVIQRIEMDEVQLFPKTGSNLDHPVVEVEIRNGTSLNVFGISFQVSLRKGDEMEPRLMEVVDRPIGAGLAPGRKASIRFELKDTEWDRAAEAGSDAVLLCGMVRLEGRRGRTIAATDYGPTDEYLHRLWQKRLDALLATPPTGADKSLTPLGVAKNNPQAASDFFYQQRFSSSRKDYPFRHLRAVLRDIEKRERHLERPDWPKRLAGGISNWTELGPGNIGGRTRALAIDPTTPDTMYAGGVAGGIWKSLDGGATWTAADDSMQNLAISTLAINPTNPRVIYAGTGEGFFWGGMVRGLGIFKSSDSGQTWKQLQSTVESVPDGAFDWVNDIIISPNDPDRVYAATRFGVWRSEDAGESWEVVLANPEYLEAEQSSRGCTLGSTELAIRTDTSPDVIFAAFGGNQEDGLYRSDDVGDTWRRLTLEGSAFQGRMALAIAPNNNNIVYVCMAQNHLGEFGKLQNVFRSDDGGETWEGRVDFETDTGPWLLSNYQIASGCVTYPIYHQGWYDNVVAVDPLDPEMIWVGGVNLFRSDDGGRTFSIGESYLAGTPRYLHLDHHALVFHPYYDGVENQTLFSASDGGIARTNRARAATATRACSPNGRFEWRDLNNGYAVTQFYHGDSAKDQDVFIGGTQDNGTNRVLSTQNPDSWRMVFGGDGGYVAINPTDSRVVYIETQDFPTIFKSTDGGVRFSPCNGGITDSDGLFITPFAMDQSNPEILWTGGSRPWRTTDGANLWKPMGQVVQWGGQISAIAIAPSDSNRVYLGYSNGVVGRTSNGTNDQPQWQTSRPTSGHAFVSSIAVDPTHPDLAYCTVSTFGFPHVFRTFDGGVTWEPINGIGVDWMPDIPAHWIAIRPSNPQQLYVATELGVFVSDNGGQRWYPSNSGLPHTVVESLDFKDDDTLVAFTHGRGVFLAELSDQGVPRPRRAGGRRSK